MLSRQAFRSLAGRNPVLAGRGPVSITLNRVFSTRGQVLAAKANDDRLVGDYPDIPFEYYQNRSPYIKYDDQQMRRNFNEPVNEHYDYGDMWSTDRFDFVSDSVALRNVAIAFGAVATFSGIIYFFFYPQRPVAKRSYPHGGLYKALGGTEEDKEIYAAKVDEGN